MKAKTKTNYSIRNILKVISLLTDSATPCDIIEFLEEEYYSKSMKKDIEYGDLDLTHFIRIFLINKNFLDENQSKYVELRRQVETIKTVIEGASKWK